MKKAIVFSVICIIGLMGFAGTARSEGNTREESLLTVPWEEFRKLLPLDKDEIVLPMETFRKLLVYSGIDLTPEHTFNQGSVVLTREEFKTMIDGLKPPLKEPEEKPPFDYLITRAVYDGKVEKNTVSFKGTFQFHVLKKDGHINIPLVPQSVALDDIRVDGEKALVVMENGYHQAMLSGPGEHEATISFSLKALTDKGAHSLDLAIQQTPMTLLTLGLPFKDMEVTIPQAQKIQTTTGEKSTLVTASITPGRAVTIRWKKKDAAVEKIPAKIYSEVNHLVSIDDDALKINSEITYRIFHSDIHGVRVELPRDINVLNVTGEAVGEWRESEENGKRILVVPFTYGKKGTAVINVSCEKALTVNSMANEFEGLRTLDTVHETGFIGMELQTSAEVNIAGNTGLETIAAQKLPPSLYTKSARPLMYAFKYSKQPFSLSFDTKKHHKVDVPVAAVNSANIVTLFTEDGKVVYHLLYQVKNSSKQFMKITLPKEADVWSVFVDEKPVESSINAEGKLLVPLIRSRCENAALESFPVEVVYCLAGEGLSLSGALESHLPAVDILISRLIWSVYLPNDYAYHYFQSTLEKEEMIRGVNVFSGSKRQYDGKVMMDMYDLAEKKAGEIETDKLGQAYKGKDYSSHFNNLPLEDDQISSQVKAELNFSGKLNRLSSRAMPQAVVGGGAAGTGIMPIQIDIPTGGQVYRFAKTIIKSDDPLNVRIMYSSNRTATMTRWLMWGLLAGLVYLIRKPLAKQLGHLKKGWVGLYETVQKHEGTLKHITQARMTPFVLFGVSVICVFISDMLALTVFLLFGVSVVYQWVYCRRQKVRKVTLADAGESMPD